MIFIQAAARPGNHPKAEEISQISQADRQMGNFHPPSRQILKTDVNS
jgi:hypothetical protein